jgi:hypothetical protein
MAADCLERAQAALKGASITDARLLDIGRWVVERTN